jgi:hypothetical protein
MGMSENKFRAAMVAMAPDADPAKNRSVVETPIHSLTTVLVRDEDEAVTICRDLVRLDGILSFIPCPGFTNAGVARVAETAGDGVSVNVAMGDNPSNAVTHRIMSEVGFFPHSPADLFIAPVRRRLTYGRWQSFLIWMTAPVLGDRRKRAFFNEIFSRRERMLSLREHRELVSRWRT